MHLTVALIMLIAEAAVVPAQSPGDVDLSFSPPAGPVLDGPLSAVLLQPDVSLDPGFNPQPNGTAYCVASQPDGTLLIVETVVPTGSDFDFIDPENPSGSRRFYRVRTQER